jgi:hypothetical protein
MAYGEFNQRIEIGVLPPFLEVLHLQGAFNQPICR